MSMFRGLCVMVAHEIGSLVGIKPFPLLGSNSTELKLDEHHHGVVAVAP